MEVLKSIIDQFDLPRAQLSFDLLTNGFINNTFLVYADKDPKYILQKLNTQVFENHQGLMNNLNLVLPVLESKNYQKVVILKAKSGKTFHKNDREEVWRMMAFISKSKVFNTTQDPAIAFESGSIIAEFHRLLNQFEVGTLQETLPDFHNIHRRYEQFQEALKNAQPRTIQKARTSIQFVEDQIDSLLSIEFNDLSKRVCHNDTKLNNILFSEQNKALCLIDLDTLMPGYFLYDFGDAVRTLVNPAPEDEKDLQKIHFDQKMFRAFAEGIASRGPLLEKREIDTLHYGAILMPFLHGIRALTDYLENNKYYKVAYPEQNLDRCKSLFRVSELTLENQIFMKECIGEILRN